MKRFEIEIRNNKKKFTSRKRLEKVTNARLRYFGKREKWRKRGKARGRGEGRERRETEPEVLNKKSYLQRLNNWYWRELLIGDWVSGDQKYKKKKKSKLKKFHLQSKLSIALGGVNCRKAHAKKNFSIFLRPHYFISLIWEKRKSKRMNSDNDW